jgi:hypothetical protein
MPRSANSLSGLPNHPNRRGKQCYKLPKHDYFAHAALLAWQEITVASSIEHIGGAMPGDSSIKFDEMHAADGTARSAYRHYDEWLNAQQLSWLRKQSEEAERFFRRTGITFNVYGYSRRMAQA